MLCLAESFISNIDNLLLSIKILILMVLVNFKTQV
jgi:hypothetical protein